MHLRRTEIRTSGAEGGHGEARAWVDRLVFIDITEDGGSGSGMERTESGAKVFSDCGGVAGGQRMPASQRAEKVWPGGLKGPGFARGACEGGAGDAASAAALGT